MRYDQPASPSFRSRAALPLLALAKFHNPNWIWFTVFVGANLLQSGLTNWCLMSALLAKAGIKDGGACGLSRTREC